MDNPVFEFVRSHWPDKAAAWDLARRPVHRQPRDASILDPATVIVADREAGIFRQLAREWTAGDDGQRRAAEEITEGQHQLDLEQASRPPVIEVTVTTPPGGIPRLELVELVHAKVAEMASPAALPVLKPASDPAEPEAPPRRRRNMLTATRRALGRDAPVPSVPDLPVLPPSEDDTPTQDLPAVSDDPGDGGELVRVIP